MAYATEADCIATYGADKVTQACDRDGDGILDSASLALALDWGASRIDSILAGRVAIPSTVPASIREANVDLALYRVSFTSDVMSDQLAKRYDQVMEELKAMASSARGVGTDTPAAPDNATPELVGGNERRLRREDLDKVM